ncbi:MAG TPA: (d)CMP kinase, partial [Planctomycetota bacterium]|nr:(d)CMP kinase [Planctomycetota bacterium]
TAAIRAESLTDSIKKVSQVPEVRAVLVRRQREMGLNLEQQYGGCVVEGRDIGSVVFPDAPVKFWLEADLEVRAQRRAKDSGSDPSPTRQTMHLSRRDKADKNPALGSLMKAADAVVLDTTNLSIDEVCQKIAAKAGLR